MTYYINILQLSDHRSVNDKKWPSVQVWNNTQIIIYFIFDWTQDKIDSNITILDCIIITWMLNIK